MAKFLLSCLALLGVLASTQALRIMVIFPMFSKSHSILGHGFVNHLLEAGHDVVHFTAFPKKNPGPNLREIDVSSISKKLMNEDDKEKMMAIKNQLNQGNIGQSIFFVYFTYLIHESFLYDPSVMEILSDPEEKFDAVIAEWFFSETISGIAPLLQCPLIWFGSTEPHWQVLRLIDEIPNPAYSVDVIATSKPPLDFLERTAQLWSLIKHYVYVNIAEIFESSLYYKVYPELAAKRGVVMPSYKEAKYNASLMFLNAHPSLGSAFKLPENVINIAGYHIDDNPSPLPKDLQKIMDEAKHGVIYFSMGSILESKSMSENMRQMLIGIFGKLKETVIWKFESDLENVPANVVLVKWAPQQRILAHSNLKFFITHGGQLSTIEAVYYGVPLIGIPVLGDQVLNMVSVEHKGFGIKVTLSEDMGDELAAAIEELLSNNKYKIRAKELSYIYHDRIATPGKELVHWVNHVVKTKGASHLRSPALHVPFYQKLYLDLAAVVIPVVFLLFKLVKVLLNKRKTVQQNRKVKKQ